MKKTYLFTLAVCFLTLSSLTQLLAQDLPKEQPKYITVIRESVKPGRAAEHAKHEAGWPAAFEKAKSPDHYIAMTSLTGPTEAWYVVPWQSFAAASETMKRENKDEALSKELDRLAKEDGEYISEIRVVQARARPDLSAGEFPDLSKVRFFHITVFRVKPGQQTLFDEAAKAYGAATKRSAPNAGFRVYQVIAGMPSPAYLVFSTVEDYADFDERMKADQEVFQGATSEEAAALRKFMDEGLINLEGNRFRLDPRQSYVPKETREKDPEFWNGK